MSITLQIKRGLTADLPASAPQGELYFATDGPVLYIGTGTGIQQLTNLVSLTVTDQDIQGIAAELTAASTINPVLVAGKGADGHTHDIATDNSGNIAVNILNFPSTQPISGTVAVSNLPTTQPVSGSVSVTNLPTTQPVSGSVSVSNLPVTQPVSGAVGIDQSTPGTTNGMGVAKATRVTGTITTSTSVVGPVATTGYSVVKVTVNGTYAGVSFVFEQSDDGGTTWYSVTGTRTDSNMQETGTTAALTNTARAWDIAIFGATHFRVRATAFVSGTANIGISPTAVQSITSPVVSLSSGTQIKVTDGTNLTTVKAASTAPLATDTALVVTVSPNTGTVKVDGSGVTQPVSGTVAVSNLPSTQAVSATSLPLPSGAATSVKQPALSTAGTPSLDVITVQGAAGMTALKVDATATTQPVSGTVTSKVQDGSGTAITSTAGALDVNIKSGSSAGTQYTEGTTQATPIGTVAFAQTSGNVVQALALDGSGNLNVNVQAGSGAVKAASTAATATDPSAVIQISPNQPALTTPLNVQGGKTNNNSAPGATNLGTLPAIANAAPPSFTEGNQAGLSIDLSGNLRVNNHPANVLGSYMVNGRTSTYTGLAAGSPLFSFRWGNASNLAVIKRVRIAVAVTGPATTPGQAERELIVARSFSASDTGGTAVTLTGNNQKMRTSQGTSLVTDMRFGTTITAGTRTLDAAPIASVVSWLGANFTGLDIGGGGSGATAATWVGVGGLGMIPLLDIAQGDYPLVLAQNEGFIIRVGKDAMPAGATQQTYVSVAWEEIPSF
jgi:hypothetical protein